MFRSILNLILILTLAGCGGNEAEFSPNNLISISEDDTANAKVNGDAHIIDLTKTAAGLEVAGIILNKIPEKPSTIEIDNIETIRKLGNVPVFP